MVELLIEGTHTGPMNGMEPTGEAVVFRDVTIRELAEPIADVVGCKRELVFDYAQSDGAPEHSTYQLTKFMVT